MPEISPYHYACMTCGAGAGDPCVTKSGKPAARVHAHRAVVPAEHREPTIKQAAEIDAELDAPAKRQRHSDATPHPNLFENQQKRRIAKGQGRSVGITPVEKGQVIQSPKHTARRARRLAAQKRRGFGSGRVAAKLGV